MARGRRGPWRPEVGPCTFRVRLLQKKKKSEGSSSRKWILGENGGSFSSTEKSGVQSRLGGMTFEEGSFESKD